MTLHHEPMWQELRRVADDDLRMRMMWSESGAVMWRFMFAVYRSLGRVAPSMNEGVTPAERERFTRRRKR